MSKFYFNMKEINDSVIWFKGHIIFIKKCDWLLGNIKFINRFLAMCKERHAILQGDRAAHLSCVQRATPSRRM